METLIMKKNNWTLTVTDNFYLSEKRTCYVVTEPNGEINFESRSYETAKSIFNFESKVF